MPETPRHVRATDRTPMSVGGYTRTIETPEDPFTERTMAFLNDDASQLSKEDKLTAEDYKTVALLAEQEDRDKQNTIETQKNADAWVAGHPEYDDKSVANGQLLVNQARTMFGKGVITVAQFEQAYQYLRENTDFLKLNKAELAKQQKEADKARYAAEMARSVGPSEQELYDMPLEDLRRLDATERQRQMQLAGERGGNGF